MQDILKKLISSKRVQASIVTLLLVLFKDKLPAEFTEEHLTYIVGIVIALILGDSVRPVVPPTPPTRGYGI